MPIYEYLCQDCSYLFEVIQSLKDEELKVCGDSCLIQSIGRVKKQMSRPSVHFKGTGFYETDYKKKESR